MRPAGSPRTKRKKIVRLKRVEVDALLEPNVAAISVKKVVKLYVMKNAVDVARNVAATTSHARGESTPSAVAGVAAGAVWAMTCTSARGTRATGRLPNPRKLSSEVTRRRLREPDDR